MTDNELIAEFMEIPKLEDYKGIMWDFQKTGKQIYSIRSNELGYNRSWDWLMPVVEKIEQLHDASYLCRIVSRRCIIYDTNIANQASVYQGSGEGIISASINQDLKLIACYKAILEFIKWYNSQK